MTRNPISRHLLPETAEVVDGHLHIGGLDVIKIAEEFGTPVFVYDEEHLRMRCREAVEAFGEGVAYASKAFLSKAMARLVHDEGMNIDVATGGEMHVALAAGVPADRLVLHGNNKSLLEIARALEVGVSRIVVDSFDEMDRIEMLVADGLARADVLLRINPGIEAHTHEYLQTGVPDSKFGFPIADGIAEHAITQAKASDAMEFHGIHAHIGSQVFNVENFGKAIEALGPFVNDSGAAEFSVGGGLGVPYVEDEHADSISDWAAAVFEAIDEAGITAKIFAEPGRSIVARAGITLYTIGTVKELPGLRTFVSVDGGMSDNPRPSLYGSGYEAFLPRATNDERPFPARVVGMHCEAGDVLVRDADLPAGTTVGDILCTPVTGAYGHAMASNYNKAPRPPVVFVKDGAARVVFEREGHDDLLRHDIG